MRKRKTVLCAVGGLLAAGATAGCSMTKTSDTVMSPSQAYMEAIHQEYPDFAAKPAVRLGRAVCTAWDANVTYQEMTTGSLLPAEEDVFVIQTATEWLCPEYESQLP